MLAGSSIGAPFVLINQAVERHSAYEPFEIGLALDWKIAPPGKAIADPGSASINFAPGIRGYLPLAPVHMNHKIIPNNDVEFSPG